MAVAVGTHSRGERWSLAGATALVTGGSKGIGHAIVEELAAFGVRVHTCSRSADELEACRRRWSDKGLHVTVTACNLAVGANRERLIETVKATFDGKLDILVNNAAQLFPKSVAQCTAEDFSRSMATNLESCFHLCQLAHPLFLNASIAGGGSVVNVSSIGGLLAYHNLTLYGTTKGQHGGDAPPPRNLTGLLPLAVDAAPRPATAAASYGVQQWCPHQLPLLLLFLQPWPWSKDRWRQVGLQIWVPSA